jgi:hypothetical protein
MHSVIVRMWTENGYHKDVVIMDEEQVRMKYVGTDPTGRHLIAGPADAVRVVIDPKLFPEACEFEVIIRK